MRDETYSMNNEELGKEYLSEFLEELIEGFRENGISSHTLITLAKALCIIENYGSVQFSGEIILQAGYSFPNDHSEYFILTMRSDEVYLTQEGFVYTPGAGSDSYEKEIFCFDEYDRYLDAEERLEHWIDGFKGYIQEGKDIEVVVDDVDDIEIDDVEEDDYEDDSEEGSEYSEYDIEEDDIVDEVVDEVTEEDEFDIDGPGENETKNDESDDNDEITRGLQGGNPS